jgi:hypothetical protein
MQRILKMTLDPLALAFCVLGLLGGLVSFIAFIGSKPSRDEVATSIRSAVEPLKSDIKYIRDRIDAVTEKKRKS